jgi:hypothetical protein
LPVDKKQWPKKMEDSFEFSGLAQDYFALEEEFERVAKNPGNNSEETAIKLRNILQEMFDYAVQDDGLSRMDQLDLVSTMHSYLTAPCGISEDMEGTFVTPSIEGKRIKMHQHTLERDIEASILVLGEMKKELAHC